LSNEEKSFFGNQAAIEQSVVGDILNVKLLDATSLLNQENK